VSVLIRYQPSNLTREQYDQVNETLQGQGSGEMPGQLLLHVLFGDEPNLRVSEIWSSEEDWRGFWDGPLGEALSAAGIEFPSEPEILPVHELDGSALAR
jgi:hypothetical protein